MSLRLKAISIIFIWVALLTTSISAENWSIGDLDGNLQIDPCDLKILAEQWLNPSGCSGLNCADLDGQNGVNMADFALLAGNWSKKINTPLITEFMASNRYTLPDEDGESSDWIEIYNPTNFTINLEGWYLTDNIGNLTKWPFPQMNLEPNQFLIIFASTRDRRNPLGQLHTNFLLDADGEYLALVANYGKTIIQEFYPEFVEQFRDVSYGLSQTHLTILPPDSAAVYHVPTIEDANTLWNTPDFNDSSFSPGQFPFTFSDGEGTNVQSEMLNINASLWLRSEFTIENPTDLQNLTLEIKYDDGFVAYINGSEVARRNAPSTLSYNCSATSEHDPAEFEQINISDHKDRLVPGLNILAIHALNYSAENPDFYIQPQIKAVQMSPEKTSMKGFFTVPTPGQYNGIADAVIGPKIQNLTHTPALPQDNNDILVTAKITETFAPIDDLWVFLLVRVMFGDENLLQMYDDGTNGDSLAADGIYSAVIPAAWSSPGQMVRYAIYAKDVQGNVSRYPPYKSQLYSEQYKGTIIADPTIQTQMPVFFWYIEDTDWYKTNGGTPYTKEYTSASVFFKQRFYDNVQVRIRGASSIAAAFPKQSMKFEFNRENRFYCSESLPALDEINVNALWVDKGFVRGMLSMETFQDAGVPYSEAEMWLGYQNGQFHSVVNFIEQPDELYLERHGLDPVGALYKIFNYLLDAVDRPAWYPGCSPNALDGVEKKTRTWEDNSDMQAFVDGILNPAGRAEFLFDNLNIPEVISFMSANIVHQCWDRFEKNYYMYRDSEGSEEWYILPWDQDLAWGYPYWWYDPLFATHDTLSHPLYGENEHPSAYGEWHRLDDAVLDNPTLKEMYLRRLRTVLDYQLQPPETAANQLKLEARIDDLIDQMASEINADKNKWGIAFPLNRTFEGEMQYMMSEYLVLRRTHLYTTHGPSGTGLVPPPQIGNPAITFGAIEVNPPVDILTDPDMSIQDAEYIELINGNPTAVDITGWKLTGGVEFTFKPGTVIASNSSLYVSPNVKAFRKRTSGPSGGQTLFVVGNYNGHLSNWGETINLIAADNTLMDTITYPPSQSDQQIYLRITEMMYHPADPEPGQPYEDEDYEYIELKNIGANTIELNGVKLTDGIYYSFPSPEPQTENITLITFTDEWNYEQSGTDLGTEWRQTDYNDTDWPSGPGLLYVESDPLPEPKNTALTLGARTYYFRKHFNLEDDPNNASISLKIKTMVDDGVVIYLNGSLLFRLGVDEEQTYYTFANRTVYNANYEGYFDIPSDKLLQGDNVLAAEVHQATDESTDIVFGIRIDAEITTYPGAEDLYLPANKHILILKNRDAFESRYDAASLKIAPGQYIGNLNNAGEKIKLEDITDSTILEFEYKDGWHELTDGTGFSLNIIDANNPDLNSWLEKTAWRPSTFLNGSPGCDDPNILPSPGSIIINELLAHSDFFPNDWIELHNTTNEPIDISGFFLSDNADDLTKYQIAEGTTIFANDFLVFTQDTNFGLLSTDPGVNVPFALSENGETVYLTSWLDANDNPTGYLNKEDFGASENGISFGRYQKSTGTHNFVAMSENTPWLPNAYPKVGPVVISEIMYHPEPDGDAEFIELYNITDTIVNLYDVDGNSWQFTDGIEFTFPPATTIASHSCLLLVKNLDSFNTAYPYAPAWVQKFQWTDGSLSNAGEKLEISMPGDVNESDILQYIRIDRVNYSDGSHPQDFNGITDPWPTGPDGLGSSLERIHLNLYGNDPNDWDANNPSPGIIPAIPSEWNVLTYDDFETGWGSYTPGGEDCQLYTFGAYAHQGNNAANIQDENGDASSFYHTNGIDVGSPAYTQIKIEFWFYAVSMETGENFQILYYDGSTWQTIETLTAGTDFENNAFYFEQIIIDSPTYNFPVNMKIKFRCNASGNTDDIYIDEVTVSAK